MDEGKSHNGDGKSQHFCNYYIAVTKHFPIKKNQIGIHAAYRKWKRDYNSKWNGLVGGITYQPSFARNLRVIAEYTGMISMWVPTACYGSICCYKPPYRTGNISPEEFASK